MKLPKQRRSFINSGGVESTSSYPLPQATRAALLVNYTKTTGGNVVAHQSIVNKPMLVKVRRFAQMADISVSQAYLLIHQKRIPAVRIGGGRSLRVPVSAIEALAKEALEECAEVN